MADSPSEEPPGNGPSRAGLRVVRLLTASSFGLYNFGNFMSLAGTLMQRMAAMLLVWQMTESAFWLGVFAMADLFPIIVIGLFAGAAADRWDRLWLTRLTQIAQLGVAVMLGIAAAGGWLDLTGLLLLALLQGCIAAVSQPAQLALVNALVGRNDLTSAVALSSVTINLARLVGPAAAGVLLLWVSVAWIFFINVGLTLVFICILWFLRPQAIGTARDRGPLLSLLGKGLRFAAADFQIRTMFIVLLLCGASVRSMAELYTVFADARFESTAAGLATLTSSSAAGAVMAGFLLGGLGHARNLGRQICLAWLGAVLALLALVFSESALWVAASAVALGFAFTLANVGIQTHVQLAVPEELRGRVLSVHGLLLRSSPAIGALLAGTAIDSFGLVPPVLVCCAIGAATAVWGLVVLRLPDGPRP